MKLLLIPESVLHAHLELFYDEGLKLSKESDKRYSKNDSLGLLDGIPIAIKDNINIMDIRQHVHQKCFQTMFHHMMQQLFQV